MEYQANRLIPNTKIHKINIKNDQGVKIELIPPFYKVCKKGLKDTCETIFIFSLNLSF